MIRKNRLTFAIVLIIFGLAVAVVLPINSGVLGGKGIRLGLDLQGGVHIVYRADLSELKPSLQDGAVDGAMAILQNRINPLGVTEPLIQRHGSDRIVVELPGIDITDKEKESLSRVAVLEFGELVTDNGSFRWENELGRWKPASAFVDGEEKILSSRYFTQNTFITQGDLGGVVLIFEFDEEGSQLSGEITGRLSLDQSPLGIFEGDDALVGESGRPIAPRVQSTITDRGQITGLSLADATRLSSQLNAGRLPIPLEVIYDQTVSPILGSDFVEKSVRAGIIGILVVMLFIILYYRLSGILASLALIFYGAIVLALFKLIPVTLTLAGLGGFILSLGMAVDANVLIFERMKEELRDGKTLGSSIEAGFNRAWNAIRDGNVTTLIICGILLWLGSSIVASAPVVAFAWSLAIGVVVSMVTAILVTRTLLRLFVGTPLARRTRLFSPQLGKKIKTREGNNV